MHATSLLPVISVFLATSRSAIAQTCYFPDKTVAERDTPCHTPTGGGASSCCAEGDICLDNNLCMSQTGYLGFSRGTCTDISWQSGNCSQYCADVDIGTGLAIFPIDLNKYCCASSGTNNDTQCSQATHGSTAPFEVPAGRVIFNRTSGSVLPNNTGTLASTITVTATPTPRSNIATETAIGAGIGAPLAVALLIVSYILLHEKRKKAVLSSQIGTLTQRYSDLLTQNRSLRDSPPSFGDRFGTKNSIGTAKTFLTEGSGSLASNKPLPELCDRRDPRFVLEIGTK